MCGWDDARVRDTVSRLHQPAKISELDYGAHGTAIHPELLEPPAEEEFDYIERNKAAWERWAPCPHRGRTESVADRRVALGTLGHT